jgi:hypothetical protein
VSRRASRRTLGIAARNDLASEAAIDSAPSRRSAIRLCGWLSASVVTLSVLPAAQAFEAETTVAGIVEQASLRSRLHRRLMARFAHPLGVLEPLRLDLAGLHNSPALGARMAATPLAAAAVIDNPRSGLRSRFVYGRLAVLSPAEGYAPEWQQEGGQLYPLARLHALGWLAAGAVIEHSPGVRVRHHFFNPATGKGLSRSTDQSASEAVGQSLASGLSSLRDAMTGTAFDGTGWAAPDWLASEENELSLPAFLRAYERAVSSAAPSERDSALAEALLCAGSMMGVLAQMADPAYVRGDLQAVLGGDGAGRVARRFGRAAVPASPAAPAEPPHHLRDLFADGAGGGLAEQTAQRCQPAWTCYAQAAVPQLAAATQSTRRLLDYLFRSELVLSLGEGSLRVRVEDWAVGSGTLWLFAEDGEGKRRLLRSLPTPPTLAGSEITQLPVSAEELAGSQRLVVLFRGRDRYNEPLVTSAQLLLSQASPPSTP